MISKWIPVFLLTSFLAAPSPASPDTLESYWYGVFLRGVKIGFSHATAEFSDTSVVTTELTVMVFSMLGSRDSVHTFVRAVSGSDYGLRSFEFILGGRDTEFSASGAVAGSDLHLEVKLGGETRLDTVECGEPPQLPSTLGLLFSREGLESGKAFRAVVFDPTLLYTQLLEVEVRGRESVGPDSGAAEAWHIVQRMAGVRVDSWLDDSGRVLREESGLGYSLVLQDSATATGGDWHNLATDIQELIAVTPDRPLPTPRQISRLEIELSGVDPDGLDLDGGVQSFDGGRLIIRASRPDRGTVGIPAPGGLSEHLKPTPFIRSDHPRLLAALAEACDPAASAEVKIRSILDWMRRNITPSPTFSLPNTIEVLDSRKGDCNEFAVLFCSLARAAGIPTRIALGLVYLDGAFYYHAWCECAPDGEWVTVDPVFGQYPADAARVRLIAGALERQVEILPLIGNLEIKVLDYGLE